MVEKEVAERPFGSGGGDCPLQESIELIFLQTPITLSKWVKIPEGAYNMRMLVSVDNDAIIYVTGYKLIQSSMNIALLWMKTLFMCQTI